MVCGIHTYWAGGLWGDSRGARRAFHTVMLMLHSLTFLSQLTVCSLQDSATVELKLAPNFCWICAPATMHEHGPAWRALDLSATWGLAAQGSNAKDHTSVHR
jgi:hypothetical protein